MKEEAKTGIKIVGTFENEGIGRRSDTVKGK